MPVSAISRSEPGCAQKDAEALRLPISFSVTSTDIPILEIYCYVFDASSDLTFHLNVPCHQLVGY